LKATNGGKVWRTNFESTNNVFNYISNMFFMNENIVWATTDGSIGDDGIYKTTDGGETWFNIIGSNNKIDEIFFINQDVGWGTRSLGTLSGIYKSTDGGTSWNKRVP
jgi:hypothetical protein